jgi:hypothetical protein
MKVFISWSGERSHAVAKALHDELTCLMNEVEPFISSEDIEKGTAWFPHISNELSNSDFGIICLTPENIESRWVHFEAGALACKFSNKKIAPLLIDLEESQIRPPLSQLNFTRFQKDDFLKLVTAINGNLKKPLTEDILKKSFDRWWSPFEKKVQEAIAKVSSASVLNPPPRKEKEILEEILGIVRSLSNGNSTSRTADIIARALQEANSNLQVKFGGRLLGRTAADEKTANDLSIEELTEVQELQPPKIKMPVRRPS